MNEADFSSRLRQTAGPLIVDVWASWCGPCRAMALALQHLEATVQGRVAVWRVNSDEQPAAVRALGVHGIPTLVAFAGGREQWQRTGAQSTSALADIFAALDVDRAPLAAVLPTSDRVLRAGAALLLLAGLSGRFPVLLVAAAALLIFSAFSDRCPLWRALTARPRRHA